MRRSEYLALAQRLIAHIENGTTDSADTVKQVPVENYLDPARWHREMDRIFKRLPLLLAFTCEMREAGDYKALDVVGPGSDRTRQRRRGAGIRQRMFASRHDDCQ